MSTTSTVVIQSNDNMSQVLVDTLSPSESVVSLAKYMYKLAEGSGNASVDMRINTSSPSGYGNVTVRGGAVGDTIVVNGTTLTAVDHRETTNITFNPDSSGSLNSKYFTFQNQAGTNKYYMWFSINGAGVDPQIANHTGIEVQAATNASAATLVAAALAAAGPQYLSPFPGVTDPTLAQGASTSILTITDNEPGVATAVTDGNTGFTFARTITGSAVSSSQYNIGFTDAGTAIREARAMMEDGSISPAVQASSTGTTVIVESASNTLTLAGTGGNSVTTMNQSNGTVASGTISLSSFVATNTITVGNQTYTGVSSSPTGNQFLIGVTDTLTAANAAAVIAANTAYAGKLTATSSGAVITVSTTNSGVLGNQVALAISAHGSVSGAFLTGGTEATSNIMHLGL